jgi:hypothetical protein
MMPALALRLATAAVDAAALATFLGGLALILLVRL